ncbi:MAG TPA: iron-containing redox enzyme family protein [Methylophilus sp.]|uniref:TenA family transcriptional regulator n=1 Tax=Methylophilus sp. TaxID=29541 RepID=UPI002C75877D|nr:iron-containing redox enzyme family protein [Methylophilus sp.]HSH86606.1 iron-containing redox enzyme family protein [Methylophilus sp.]
MTFYEQLLQATQAERNALLSVPFIVHGAAGELSLDAYVAFLGQAYHHVKHTIPLLMSTGGRLPERYEWLRVALGEYIEEEMGHQEWILNDIQACGFDKEQVRHGQPGLATELMVAYAYDMIQRVNPIGFFGMVLVLEGTSTAVASHAAKAISTSLKLPASCFSYLSSHGALDVEHTRFYEGLVNNIPAGQDQALLIHAAKVFYKLYADIFRELGEKYLGNGLK